MTEQEKKIIEELGLNEDDFNPNEETTEQRITRLEEEIIALKSYVNSLGKTELVGDGSADKPFDLVVGMELVPNAYYNYDGVRYVYMSSAKTWDGSELSFDNGWTEF